MELQGDRIETTVRLLQNGRYTWTITLNASASDPTFAIKLKEMDGALRDAFPNHVKENSIKFSQFEE